MDTLDEVRRFCEEGNPTGALMITGGWGSGKTYFIKNNIKNELKDTHIVVHISLFGITDIDGFHSIVKKRWIDECAPFFSDDSDAEWFEVGKKIISTAKKSFQE